jgi:hypothetical protein
MYNHGEDHDLYYYSFLGSHKKKWENTKKN